MPQTIIQDRVAILAPLRLMRDPVILLRLPPAPTHPAQLAALMINRRQVLGLQLAIRTTLNQLHAHAHAADNEKGRSRVTTGLPM